MARGGKELFENIPPEEKNFGDLPGHHLPDAGRHSGGQVRTAFADQLQVEVWMSGEVVCQLVEAVDLWLCEHLSDREIEIQCPGVAGGGEG